MQIPDTLLDQDAVALPFDQGPLEQVDQPFGLARIVTACHEFAHPVFLISDPLPAFLDVLSAFTRRVCSALSWAVRSAREMAMRRL
jgi:hypothetical protein